MKRTILSLGVGTLVMGVLFLMAGCEACCPKPCKTQAKPVCASYRCNGGLQQKDGSSWKQSRCSICGTQKTTYTRNGATYSKCPKCNK